jgi:hypothetical protein
MMRRFDEYMQEQQLSEYIDNVHECVDILIREFSEARGGWYKPKGPQATPLADEVKQKVDDTLRNLQNTLRNFYKRVKPTVSAAGVTAQGQQPVPAQVVPEPGRLQQWGQKLGQKLGQWARPMGSVKDWFIHYQPEGVPLVESVEELIEAGPTWYQQPQRAQADTFTQVVQQLYKDIGHQMKTLANDIWQVAGQTGGQPLTKAERLTSSAGEKVDDTGATKRWSDVSTEDLKQLAAMGNPQARKELDNRTAGATKTWSNVRARDLRQLVAMGNPQAEKELARRQALNKRGDLYRS